MSSRARSVQSVMLGTPWPVPVNAPAAWLLGGTFDPPHEGHVGLALRARAMIEPDAWLVLVPAARSPFKSGAGQSSARDRVEMVQRAIVGRERCAIWTEEVDRAASTPGQPSYTIDTLRRAHECAPSTRLTLLIGSDQAASFHRWKEPREILRLARVRVMGRGAIATRPALEHVLRDTACWSESEIGEWCKALIDDLPRHDASATAIRAMVREGGVRSVPAGWLAPAVAEYIQDRGLYKQ